MKMLKIVLIISLGAVLCSATVAQKENYEKKIDKFLAGILKGEIDKSYDELFADTVMEQKKQGVQIVKGQTHNALNLYGQATGYEFIKQQKYGDCLVRLVYIVKCEQVPVTFEFYCYKTTADWKLIYINMSDKYDLLANK